MKNNNNILMESSSYINQLIFVFLVKEMLSWTALILCLCHQPNLVVDLFFKGVYDGKSVLLIRLWKTWGD